jgi:hypothetical protein
VVWVRSTDYVAWWNLVNLFDEENSSRRSERLQRALGADFAGWTPPRRDRKVAQLASVIAQMNGGAGPVPGAGNRDVAGETLSYFHQRELIGPKIWWRSLAREEEQGGPREPGERLAVEA